MGKESSDTLGSLTLLKFSEVPNTSRRLAAKGQSLVGSVRGCTRKVRLSSTRSMATLQNRATLRYGQSQNRTRKLFVIVRISRKLCVEPSAQVETKGLVNWSTTRAVRYIAMHSFGLQGPYREIPERIPRTRMEQLC